MVIEFTNYFSTNNDDIIVLDLWGGSHIYYKKTKSYIISRDCGFFSNVTVTMFGIFLLKINGYEINDLKLTMTDYSFEDIYPQYFIKNEDYNLTFDDLTEKDLMDFLVYSHPSKFGLGYPKPSHMDFYDRSLNLEITNRLIKKYFTPNSEVFNYYKSLCLKKGITNDDYVFIWARRTDKIEENSIPNAEQYYNVLKSNNLLTERIFVQTDDQTMFNEFKELDMSFEYFDEIPFAKGYCFHRLISKTPDDEFFNDYKINKKEYNMQIISIVLLALNAKKCLIYPGCGSTVVPMYKNTYNNCFLFSDDQNLY